MARLTRLGRNVEVWICYTPSVTLYFVWSVRVVRVIKMMCSRYTVVLYCSCIYTILSQPFDLCFASLRSRFAFLRSSLLGVSCGTPFGIEG